MRLVHKLSVAFMVGTTAILAVNGVRRVRREVGYCQADRVRDHDLIGHALAASVGAVWQLQGQAQAMRLLDAANAGEGKIRIRWVALAGPASGPLHVGAAGLARLPPGATTTVIAADDHREDERFTYAPVPAVSPPGALELSERLDAERAFTRRTILDSGRTTLALGLLTALLSYALRSWLVGRPVRALVEKARCMARKDFGGPVKLPARDELGELATEMNATADALVAADTRVAGETAARIAALEQLRHADADKQGVSLRLEDAAGPCATRLDAGQVEQALTNLVVNAVQASPEGSEVDVRVTRERPPDDAAGPERDLVVVRVRDRGAGIAPENLARVFEPFFTTKDVGSGTGLSVAHGSASDHGGWIDVDSEPGQGSTFALFLAVES